MPARRRGGRLETIVGDRDAGAGCASSVRSRSALGAFEQRGATLSAADGYYLLAPGAHPRARPCGDAAPARGMAAGAVTVIETSRVRRRRPQARSNSAAPPCPPPTDIIYWRPGPHPRARPCADAAPARGMAAGAVTVIETSRVRRRRP